MATILAVKESLAWYAARVGHDDLARVANLVEQAVSDTVSAGDCLTYDLVGEAAASSTSEVGDAVVQRLQGLLG